MIAAPTEPKLFFSSCALGIGCLNLFGGVALSLRFPTRPWMSMVFSGYCIMTGALAYRSAKRRRHGARKDAWYRRALEWCAIGLVVLLFLFIPGMAMAQDPLTHLVIPLWAVAAYAWVTPDIRRGRPGSP